MLTELNVYLVAVICIEWDCLKWILNHLSGISWMKAIAVTRCGDISMIRILKWTIKLIEISVVLIVKEVLINA